MTTEQWESLVRRLEPEAREDPRGYGRKVAALAGLGYAVLGLSLVTLVALAALVVLLAIEGPGALLKLVVPIAALAWVVTRSLAVRLDAPEGIPLRENEAPALFRMVAEVNQQIDGPKIHRALVDASLNAGVVQNPRLGGLLGQRNYLVVGVPLMQALSPDEFRAVIAHELGHLSKNHGRFGAWIYRVRMTWALLLEALEEKRHWGSGLFRRFFAWYSPYFAAYTFPLMRAHEFEADRAAAEAAGPRPTATSLARLAFAARYVDQEYWPRIYEAVTSEPEPPRKAFSALAERLPSASAHRSAKAWFDDELAEPANGADTHPSLADRLRHLGCEPEEIFRAATSNGAATGRTAAQIYLGERETALANQLEEAWRDSVLPDWRERHREAQQNLRKLEELETRAERGVLSADDARALADLTYDFRGADEALPRFRELLERHPSDATANFAVGQLLLARGDDTGLRHLERAMENDPEAVVPACRSAFVYLTERGRQEEADRYHERAERQLETLEAASEERETVSAGDAFEPHGLTDDLVAELRQQLERHKEVQAAYLVKKAVQHLADEQPFYVVGIVPKHRFRQAWRDADDDSPSLAQRLAAELEAPFDFQVVVHHPRSELKDRIASVPRAEIFGRR